MIAQYSQQIMHTIGTPISNKLDFNQAYRETTGSVLSQS
jgi:hypothetical protein